MITFDEVSNNQRFTPKSTANLIAFDRGGPPARKKTA
jgi:hypothetical protein